jgi:two-component system, LytTR family, sensor histidine kinase AlgZ
VQVPSPASQSRSPLLPPELPWLYLFLPLPAAFLVGGNLLQESSPELQHALIKMYVPWLAYGVAYQLVYNHNRLVPRALEALSRWQRLLFHVGVICVVTPVAALGIVPLLEWLCGETMNRGDFLTVSFIFSSASLFPSLAVQSLRVRAQAAEQKAQLERRAALEAQLQALQARTDPHFLFNSLNTVASLIPEDPELAERTLERLADLFRYALDSSRLRTVRLERELAMVADYLALQSTRFGERLHTRLDVDSGLGDIEVPPLLLQPLVENAILHGTAQRKRGRVEIAVRREQDSLVVEVCDDGPGPGASGHTGAGSAIAGVTERLRLHYAERGSLQLSAHPAGGCLARLALPIGGEA